jgi:hypothetical protein
MSEYVPLNIEEIDEHLESRETDALLLNSHASFSKEQLILFDSNISNLSANTQVFRNSDNSDELTFWGNFQHMGETNILETNLALLDSIESSNTPFNYQDISFQEFFDPTLEDLSQSLNQAEQVLVTLDRDTLQFLPPVSHIEDELLSDTQMTSIPGQHNIEAWQVLGIDNTDISNSVVLISNPNINDGESIAIPLEHFAAAWQQTDHYMVSGSVSNTNPHSLDPLIGDSEEPSIKGGYAASILRLINGLGKT